MGQNTAKKCRGYDLAKQENGIPLIKRFVDNFTEKNFNKAYGIDKSDISSHRYRSWEHCRKAFLDARQEANENKLSFDDSTVSNLALHLAFYLASWGMYRGSSFLLSLDYVVHKEIVKIVMKKDYDALFDSDTLIIQDQQKYLDLLFGNKQENIPGVVNEIKAWYKDWHDKVVSDPINSTDAETEPKTTQNEVSYVLVTKVLMGVYGCIPAYDRYVMDGLKTQNINASFGRKAVENLLDEVVNKKDVYNNIVNVQKSIFLLQDKEYTDFDLKNYTFMKVVDMLFWEIGAGDLVYVTVNEKKSLSERDVEIINEIENAVLNRQFSTYYEYEICGITFASANIGSLIMCIYEELKEKLKNNEKIQKGNVKKYIESKLENEWLATARYSRKLVK